MTTPSPRLGLLRPVTTDPFVTADISGNWQRIDDSPGVYICTSSTRPTSWSTAHNGMLIHETDSGLYYRWNGTGWASAGRFASPIASSPALLVRAAPGQTDSSPALEVQDASQTPKFRVSPSGHARANYYTNINDAGPYLDSSNGLWLLLVHRGVAGTKSPALVLRNYAGSVADLLQFQDSNQTLLGHFASDGTIYANKLRAGPQATTPSVTATQHMIAGDASVNNNVLLIQAGVGQGANLTEWRSSTGTLRAQVDVEGVFTAASFIASLDQNGYIQGHDLLLSGEIELWSQFGTAPSRSGAISLYCRSGNLYYMNYAGTEYRVATM